MPVNHMKNLTRLFLTAVSPVQDTPVCTDNSDRSNAVCDGFFFLLLRFLFYLIFFFRKRHFTTYHIPAQPVWFFSTARETRARDYRRDDNSYSRQYTIVNGLSEHLFCTRGVRNSMTAAYETGGRRRRQFILPFYYPSLCTRSGLDRLSFATSVVIVTREPIRFADAKRSWIIICKTQNRIREKEGKK